MSEKITSARSATVVLENGGEISDVPVRIYENWVRISAGDTHDYYPRENIKRISI